MKRSPYTIEAAFAANIFSKIIVSTDSQKITAIAIEHGAEVPFLRPDELSGDAVSSDDVLLSVSYTIKPMFPDCIGN